MSAKLKFALLVVFISATLFAQSDNISSFTVKNIDELELVNVNAEKTVHQKMDCIKISAVSTDFEGETLVLFPGIEFSNGTIEAELAGEVATGANPNMRGFVGIAFRLNKNEHYNYECIYLRPANGRAPEQIRRNHSTQYISHPAYPWYRLRKENPGVYESYVDLVPGNWTKIKIEVKNNVAKLFVHGSNQPCLVVNDLKLDNKKGGIALWMHSTTLAHLKNIVIKPEK